MPYEYASTHKYPYHGTSSHRIHNTPCPRPILHQSAAFLCCTVIVGMVTNVPLATKWVPTSNRWSKHANRYPVDSTCEAIAATETDACFCTKTLLRPPTAIAALIKRRRSSVEFASKIPWRSITSLAYRPIAITSFVSSV